MRRHLKDLRPAPGDLRIVQAFVNTDDLEMKTDELTSPRSLADWLIHQALLPAGTVLDAADLERTSALRRGLRALVLAGESARRELGEAVERTALAAVVRFRVEAGGRIELVPAGTGLDAAVGRILTILAAAQRDGLWPRFKICGRKSCRAAFYDFSTNRSSLWCSPRCGGRIRTRDFRRRHGRGRR